MKEYFRLNFLSHKGSTGYGKFFRSLRRLYAKRDKTLVLNSFFCGNNVHSLNPGFQLD